MPWEIKTTETFDTWFLELTDGEQEDVLAMIDVLEIEGPQLSRPQADTLRNSKKVKNLKELRIQHAGDPYRVFYAFDYERQCVLLCGGRKNGSKDKRFYKLMIPLAEKEFAKHVADKPQSVGDIV